MSDSANSSGAPTSLAQALYPSGPASAPVGPTAGTIDQGRAGGAPAAQPVSRPPQPASPRAAAPSGRPGEPPPEQKSLGDAFYGKSAETGGDAAFDPQKVAVPENVQVDAAMMGEFSSAAKELGLSHAHAEKLLTLHSRAVAAQEAAADRQAEQWAEEARGHYGERLSETVAELRSRIGQDADGKEFLRLMAHSRLGSNPTVIRVLERLSRGY